MSNEPMHDRDLAPEYRARFYELFSAKLAADQLAIEHVGRDGAKYAEAEASGRSALTSLHELCREIGRKRHATRTVLAYLLADRVAHQVEIMSTDWWVACDLSAFAMRELRRCYGVDGIYAERRAA